MYLIILTKITSRNLPTFLGIVDKDTYAHMMLSFYFVVHIFVVLHFCCCSAVPYTTGIVVHYAYKGWARDAEPCPTARHWGPLHTDAQVGTVKRGNIGVFFVENLKSLEICYTWPQNFFWPWGALWWGLNGGKAFLGLCHHLDPNFFIFLRLPMFCTRQQHRHMVIFFLTKDDLIPPLVTSAYWECFKKIVEIRTKR